MREITRIHLAKVAYDIEIEAKKEIEQYIAALERYASDPEILDDIEIRITELLAEQGVVAGGVITKNDVAAVRAQLGEPSDFASEGAADAVGDAMGDTGAVKDEPRRVYRDEENAVLGGVLAGFGRFFGIDPLWVRLLFIVILLGSFGTALIVYLLLWLIIPPAHTAADKLRMSGRAVTLASIKELGGNEERRSKNAQALRRFLGGFIGVLLVIMGIAGLLAIVVVLFGLQIAPGWSEFAPVTEGWIYESWWFMAMMGLFVLSGVLFSTLCFTLASTAFKRRWTKRIGIAVVAIVTAGLVSFASGVGAGMYGYTAEYDRIMALHKTTTGDLPTNFKGVKKLTFELDERNSVNGPIQYHVSDTFRYELDTLPGIEPRFEVSSDGSSATVSLVRTDKNWSPWDARGVQTWRPWHSLGLPILNVYGPSVDTIEVARGNRDVSYSNDEGQASLSVEIGADSEFRLSGFFDSVSVVGGKRSSASLEGAAIGGLSVDGGRVIAGVVRLLTISQPDVCSGWETSAYGELVQVRGVSGGKLIYNGVEQPAKTIENDCGRVVVGDE